ncbi:MAG: RNA polymerase sigma factor [Bacteroidota bacterium]
MPVADERQLIIEAKEGNHQAFRQLVERHMKQAYNIAYGFLHHHELAQDVTQDAFVRVYHALPSFRGDAEFSTWLYRIITNLALNRMKMEKSRVQRFEANGNGELNAISRDSGSAENKELRDHVERALHELPTLQRSVVILRHLEGLSTRQVSGILSCSEGTVKTHLFRGLKKLRKRLEYFRTEIT